MRRKKERENRESQRERERERERETTKALNRAKQMKERWGVNRE